MTEQRSLTLTEGLHGPEAVLNHAVISALMIHVVHAHPPGACVSKSALPLLAVLKHRGAACALLAAVHALPQWPGCS